jgi:hypothetical protein
MASPNLLVCHGILRWLLLLKELFKNIFDTFFPYQCLC